MSACHSPAAVAPHFTQPQREQLQALAGIVAGGHEGRTVSGEFDIGEEMGEAFYLMPGGVPGYMLLAVVFDDNGALAVSLPGGALSGPYADVAAVSEAVLRLLGRRVA